jgi:hypothetical protein
VREGGGREGRALKGTKGRIARTLTEGKKPSCRNKRKNELEETLQDKTKVRKECEWRGGAGGRAEVEYISY